MKNQKYLVAIERKPNGILDQVSLMEPIVMTKEDTLMWCKELNWDSSIETLEGTDFVHVKPEGYMNNHIYIAKKLISNGKAWEIQKKIYILFNTKKDIFFLLKEEPLDLEKEVIKFK